MKICFFNTAKVWGGGEKWHLDVASACCRLGHDVTVVSYKNGELIRRSKQIGLKTKEFKLSNLSFLNPYKWNRIYSFFKKEQFDVVIFNFSKDLKNAAFQAKKAGIKRIVYRRGSAIPIKNSWLNRFIFGKCLTDVIANSEATKQTILQNNPDLFPEEKIKVIYNGIDLSGFHLAEKTIGKIPVIGNLGRCVYQKGQDILLEIAAILKKRRVDFKLIIGGDGVLSEQLKQRTESLGLSDRVEFSGFVDDPARFMQSIDIFALTSRWEGFGYVIAEAMACELPVVAFDVSSNPELVVNKVTGYLVPFEDKEAFADALEDLIRNAGKRASFGKAGLKTAQDRFDFDKNLQTTIQFLENSSYVCV
ncbi:MAG: glycosyltransferase family 4 protein [Candidatus Azobacteroides sp.]|nr:glycosyltransferase family 4 protein [Candidatus Azobacteroides sp.]